MCFAGLEINRRQCSNIADTYMGADTNNADTYMGRNSTRTSIFGRELLSFCDENILVLSDVEKLSESGDVFTHYSDAHDSVSWLDHCMTSTAADKLITDISVSDRFAVSDHLPLCITVNIGGIHLSDDDICPSIKKHTVILVGSTCLMMIYVPLSRNTLSCGAV